MSGARIKDANESRQAAITSEETPSAWANRMKIEAVEAANNPKGRASVGGMGGRFGELGKGLSRLWNMPENFASQPSFGNRTKVAAVRALWMCADDKDFIVLGIDVLDAFDHCTVNRMFEDHDITRFE